MLGIQVQNFIQKILFKEKLTRKDFAKKVGISYSSVNELINANKTYPSVVTLIKIVNSFNCSINEICGKYPAEENYQQINQEEVFDNIKNYIIQRLNKEKITAKELAKKVGLSSTAIYDFTKTPPKKNFVGMEILLRLSDYWEISLDEILGRVTATQTKSLNYKNTKTLERI